MAEVLKSGIGAIYSISATEPETYDAAGFAALTYTEVGEVITIGAFGGNAEILSQAAVKTGVVKKVKGSKNYGSQAIQFGKQTDAGQALLQAGFDGAAEAQVHSIKIEYVDGTVRYFTGLVASYEFQEISSSSFDNGASTIEVNNKIVVVEAA